MFATYLRNNCIEAEMLVKWRWGFFLGPYIHNTLIVIRFGNTYPLKALLAIFFELSYLIDF
jgi:hypothetical protein